MSLGQSDGPLQGAEPGSKVRSRAVRVRPRERVSALIAGGIDKCFHLSDPAMVKEKGRETAEKFFKRISGLVKFAKVQPQDRVIKSITPLNDGQSAKLEIELTLKGKQHPPRLRNLGPRRWPMALSGDDQMSTTS